MTKRVLVTGGAGFLGSHLCEMLLEQGCEVLCVDNFFTGARGNIDELLTTANSRSYGTTLRTRCMSKSTRSTTSPVRHLPSTISMIPCTRPRPA